METSDQRVVDPPQPLTPDQLRTKKLFKQTYFFSQGHIGLQEYLFKYLLSKHAFPNAELRHMGTPDYLNLKIPKRHNPLSNDQRRTDELDSRYRSLQALSRNVEIDESEVLKEILRGIAERDVKFMITGRPMGSEMRDPFESHVKRWIVDGESTGTTEFDNLFSALQPMHHEQRTRDTLVRYSNVMDDPKVERLAKIYTDTELSKDEKEEAEDFVFYGTGNSELFSLTSRLWEYRHPGQSFVPATEAAA